MTAATESDLRKIEEAITTLTDLANPANAGTATAQQMLPAARAALLAAIEKYGDERVRAYKNRPYDPRERFNYDC